MITQRRSEEHPATLLEKCTVCGFALKNHLNLTETDAPPSWNLFCPNLTCSLFGQVVICVIHKKATPSITQEPTLFPAVAPDTTIEED